MRSSRSMNLMDGRRVEVKGELRDGFVYAVRIHINGLTGTEPPQDDSASVEGVLDELAEGGSGWTLTLLTKFGPVTVTTTADTVVQRRGDVQTLADLAEGQTIHAVGTRMAGQDHRRAAVADQGRRDLTGAFTIEGSLGGLKGACPSFTFGINGFSITTDAATVWDPVPTPPDNCLVLKSGMKVAVQGTRQADGSVLAGDSDEEVRFTGPASTVLCRTPAVPRSRERRDHAAQAANRPITSRSWVPDRGC